MVRINDDMHKIVQSIKKIKKKDRICIPNEGVIYKIMMEKSEQIKRGECPEPYSYNPMPKMWWED